MHKKKITSWVVLKLASHLTLGLSLHGSTEELPPRKQLDGPTQRDCPSPQLESTLGQAATPLEPRICLPQDPCSCGAAIAAHVSWPPVGLSAPLPGAPT